jgi:hypothetical protein
VLPDVDARTMEAMVMHTCDGKERTELDWHALLGGHNAGFNIMKIWRADVGTTAVVEAVVA